MKEQLKEFALAKKLETGKFPLKEDWKLKHNYPISTSKLVKLFGGYNNFRNYCEQPQLIRTEKITLDWIRSQCNIDENGCWNWLRNLTSSGYGYLKLDNKTSATHRVSYFLKNGNLTEGLVIRHLCNNKRCCNPSHLLEGTYSENSLDARECHSKLTKADILEIRSDQLNWDFSIRGNKTNFDKVWSDKLKVSPDSIRHIRMNNSWKDVE